MKYTIEWMEKKNNDWIVASLMGEDRTNYKDVSVNRTSKKGEAFPGFDEFSPGGTVEGEIWQSQAGKWYLFAPQKPKTGQGGAFKQKMIEETMNKKAESIERFQGSKEYSIKVSSTFRAAVDTAIEEARLHPGISLDALFEKWRKYYWFEFDVDDNKYPPFK